MQRWDKKTVLVTGASAGLGQAIAEEFASRGAQVVAAARNRERLEKVCESLSSEDRSIEPLVMDVTNRDEIQKGIATVVERFETLDVLVNCVGRSTRADVGKEFADTYRELMEVNFYSLVNCTTEALPHLIKAKGHCINIGSLSSKTAWPYMAPYSASKFAVAAYTHQLRIETTREVHFMLVCPGPIVRDDAGERYRDAAAGLPSGAQAPGAGAKIKGIRPHELARRIVQGCESRKAELIVPAKAKLLFIAAQISPRLGDWMIRKMNKATEKPQ